MKKLFIVMMLFLGVAGTTCLQARNKQQIFLTNKYDADISIALLWKNSNFPYDFKNQALILQKGAENIRIKAPVSTYRLLGLYTKLFLKEGLKKDAKNILLGYGLGVSSITLGGALGVAETVTAAPLIAAGSVPLMAAGVVMISYPWFLAINNELSNSMHNNCNMPNVHDNTYFVIEQGLKKTKTHNDQIVIRAYTSEESYRKNPGKADTSIEQLSESIEKEILNIEPFSDEVILASIESDATENLEDRQKTEILLDGLSAA